MRSYKYKLRALLAIPILISIFIGIPYGCKKNQTKYHISDQVKAYTLFLPGTYWIYQNNETGEIDSVYIFNLQNDFEQLGNSDEYQEAITVSYQSIKSGFYPGVLLADTKKTDSCFDASEYFNDFLRYFFFYYSCSYDSTYFYGYKNYYESFLLNQKPFSNVREFTLTQQGYYTLSNYLPDSALISTIHYSKNIGLIRWEYNNGQAWELVNYQAIQ